MRSAHVWWWCFSCVCVCSPFFDDQNCGYADDLIVNVNYFFCENVRRATLREHALTPASSPQALRTRGRRST
jgi:hypothetical protein